eukprot:TRINITY_DN4641_c0_g1_i1.p1 TRINITY_DN4641_c0_g1~~TRINITY_DN4641_c0_g1_i1.p1  ORF type:complete len:504 (+),score=93.39 TRINITY_DN4641_c0_g1_i1:1096-2607(+)
MYGRDKLKGFLLVTKGHTGGDQLCFRYPPKKDQLHNRDKASDPLPVGEEPPAATKGTFHCPLEFSSKVLAPLLCSSKLPCNTAFELVIGDTMFIGWPSNFDKETVTDNDLRKTDLGSSIEGESFSMFSFVLVIDRDSDASFMRMCKNIVQQVTVASLYEEKRCGYLRQQMTRLLNIRERRRSKNSKAIKSQEFTTQIGLQASSLAVLIRDIYTGLTEHGYINCRLNDWISLSLSLKDHDDHPQVPLRPYQTILLLEKTDKFLASLPADASRQLKLLVKSTKPTMSFALLQSEMGVPLSQLYIITSHLIYWGKARIIGILSKLNTYILNPCMTYNGNSSQFMQQQYEFNREFPNFDFCEILGTFSFPCKLGDHIERLTTSTRKGTLEAEFIEMVCWLIRNNLVILLRTYVFLVLPGISSPRHPPGVPQEEAYTLSPIPLTAEEEAYLDKKFNDGSQTFLVFKKLCRFFRGYHHYEEIMWRENIKREVLMDIIERYSEVLVTANL